MNNYVLPILLVLICTIQVSEEPTTRFYNSAGRSEFIEVLDNKYKYGDEIKLLVQGELRATGDCIANPQLGLIRKNETNSWDTLVAVNQLPVFMFGFGSHKWTKDILTIFLPELIKPYMYEKGNVSGIYRLTFMPYKKGKEVIKSSNEFEIEL